MARRPNLFHTLWFSMRSCHKAQPVRLPPPFLATRKGEKNRQGATPPEPPGSLPTFFLGKSTRTSLFKPAYIKKGRGPGIWDCCIFSAPRPIDPGAAAPILSLVFYGNGGEVLLKREPTGSPGSGETPAAFLHPFSAVGKRMWPAGQTYSIHYGFLCAHAIKHNLCFGTSFLRVKKGCKETSGGSAP